MGLFGKKEKKFCYSCKKEFGMVSIKWTLDELKNKEPPKGMSTVDRICGNCKENLVKKGKPIKEEQIKNESTHTGITFAHNVNLENQNISKEEYRKITQKDFDKLEPKDKKIIQQLRSKFHDEPDFVEVGKLYRIKSKRISELLKKSRDLETDHILTSGILGVGTGQEQKQMKQDVFMEIDRLTDELKEIGIKQGRILDERVEKYLDEINLKKKEEQVEKSNEDEAIKIIRLRYAKGEITKEEFTKMSKALEKE
jgi:hypothetical protein